MSVKALVREMEDSANYDVLIGWMEGINSVNQNKHYVQINIESYERYREGNIRFPKRPYVLWYLQQEENYYKIYPQLTEFKRDDIDEV